MLKRLGFTLAGVAVLVVALALALPWLVPQRFAYDRLDAALRRSGNVQLERAGTIRVSLFPTPGFTVEDVTLRARKALRKLPPLSAARIFVAIDSASVFKGKLTATKVTVERPEMIFGADNPRQDEVAAQGSVSGGGTGSPADATPAPDERRDASPSPQAAPDQARRLKIPTLTAEMTDGAIIVRNGGQQRRIAFARGDFQLRGGEADGVASITGNLDVGGDDVRISLTAGTAGTPAADPAPLELRVDAPALRWTLNGMLSPGAGGQFAGTTRLEVLSAQPLMTWLGNDSKLLGSFGGATLEGRVSVAPEGYAMTDAKISASGLTGEFDVSGNPGGVNITLKSLALHGGHGEGRVTLGTAAEAELRAELTLTGVDSLALAKAVSTFDWVSGTMDIALSVSARSDDTAHLHEALTGDARVSVAGGAIEGFDLPQIVADISNGDFKKWKRDLTQRTPFDRFTAVFAIDKGTAATKDLSLTGPNISATGEGSAEIASRKLDFRLKTQVTAASAPAPAPPPPANGNAGATPPAPPQAAALTVPLRVKGDWKKPSIKPDLGEALKDAKGLRGNAALLGKSLEKATGGKLKADDVGNAIKSLFGKKQKNE